MIFAMRWSISTIQNMHMHTYVQVVSQSLPDRLIRELMGRARILKEHHGYTLCIVYIYFFFRLCHHFFLSALDLYLVCRDVTKSEQGTRLLSRFFSLFFLSLSIYIYIYIFLLLSICLSIRGEGGAPLSSFAPLLELSFTM